MVLPYANAQAWDAIVWDMERHGSQFSVAFIAAIQGVPPHERAVFIALADTVLSQPVTACP